MESTDALQPLWDDDLVATNPSAGPDWLLHGFVARGATTLLTSPPKLGKTTFLSIFLSRRITGGSLAGLAVAPGRTVVVSEEPREVWTERTRRFGFHGRNCCFLCRPFRTIPTAAEWQALIDRILAVHAERPLDLVIIDPLAPFLRSENCAQALLERLLPLHALTRAHLAVMLSHHAAKGAPPIGMAARGSGALVGHVDISIELRHPGGDPLTRRRRLLALSRFVDTPRQTLVELDAAGTDYIAIAADTVIDDFPTSWQVVRSVLLEAPQKLTRLDILAEWPEDFDKPHKDTLLRWLNRALSENLVQCEGTGHKGDPFRYWLAETEAKWRERNPFYDRMREQERELNLPYKSLQQLKREGWTYGVDDDFASGRDDVDE